MKENFIDTYLGYLCEKGKKKQEYKEGQGQKSIISSQEMDTLRVSLKTYILWAQVRREELLGIFYPFVFSKKHML